MVKSSCPSPSSAVSTACWSPPRKWCCRRRSSLRARPWKKLCYVMQQGTNSTTAAPSPSRDCWTPPMIWSLTSGPTVTPFPPTCARSWSALNLLGRTSPPWPRRTCSTWCSRNSPPARPICTPPASPIWRWATFLKNSSAAFPKRTTRTPGSTTPRARSSS